MTSSWVHTKDRSGFTIVELLIVIVVIAILAAITIVGYNGVSSRARESSLKSDLQAGLTQLHMAKAEQDTYPLHAGGLKKSETTNYSYSAGASTFCLVASSGGLPGKSFYVTQEGVISEGSCLATITTGSYMQGVTTANCPTSRTRVTDARDNRSYWIQRLADGKCWMLTNLAYAGGGSNTYADTKTLINKTGEISPTIDTPNYAIPNTGSNPTTEPTNPSTSTTGTGQYGYLYNWCAALGGQIGTAACGPVITPAVDSYISICPAGWRLPTGNTGGEFAALNNAINSGSTSSDASLRSVWFAQYAGHFADASSFLHGLNGYYWSSSQQQTFAVQAHILSIESSGTNVNVTTAYLPKAWHLAVRCIAN